MGQIKDILRTMEYGPAPESNTDVQSWLDANKAGFGHFINGKFTGTEGRETFAVINPANDAVLTKVAHGTAADVDAAVKAARAAFGKWSKLPGHERAKYLYAIARHIQKRERFFSVLETMDNGKPIRETRDIDIPLVARHFYHHAGWAEMVETEFEGFSPVGVCGQVIPWNFPLLMLAWKIAPALAAGNTVVLKPAELTPLTAVAFAEVCHEIGLPAGVVNIVHGDGATGAAICGHDDIDKVAFTGSTEVGRIIREQIAGSEKKLSLELGGKSPFIVFEDADIDGAVEGVVDAIWFNQGEVCCAGSRLLIQEGIAERFYAKLRKRMETLRVGDPLDKTMDVGAIVSKGQLKRITSLVEQGKVEGGTLWQAPVTLPSKGAFFAPGFFTDVEPASTVCEVEIFGPVATATTFRTPDEAIALANNTKYGLAASVWSENINLALDMAARVKAGDILIGLPSSGLHSNGFSLVRKIVFERMKFTGDEKFSDDKTLGEELLTPTRLYPATVLPLIKKFGEKIHGLVHVTGGGFYDNIPRALPEGLGVTIDAGNWSIPKIFKLLQEWGNVPRREMFRTFNCGIGMILIVDAEIADDLTDEIFYKIGSVVEGNGVEILGGELSD